jgi:DNA-binding NtrC family response regulator
MPDGAFVLCVDDEPIILTLLQTILDMDKHKSWLAHNLADAARMAVNGSFDIILTDLNMPEMRVGDTVLNDGIDLLAYVYSHGYTGPALLCTAALDSSVKRRVDELGLSQVTVMEKPFDLPVLRAKVREAALA